MAPPVSRTSPVKIGHDGRRQVGLVRAVPSIAPTGKTQSRRTKPAHGQVCMRVAEGWAKVTPASITSQITATIAVRRSLGGRTVGPETATAGAEAAKRGMVWGRVGVFPARKSRENVG